MTQIFSLLFALCFFVKPVFATDALEQIGYHEGETIYSASECYTIIKVLGAGAFGRVYEVKASDGQHYALKSYHPQTEDVNFFMKILGDAQREFQLGQQLNHPNIIKSYDIFNGVSSEDKQITCLVLQLVEGMPLYTNSRGLLTPEEAREAAKSFCDALEYAFSIGYLNLDLHSANIMLSDKHDLILIDLASFFTFDEVYEFFNNEAPSLDEKASLTSSVTLPARQAKMKAFFDKHPKLEKRMKIEALKPKKSPSYNDPKSALLNTHLSICFDRMTDICVSLLSKTTMPREAKINKLAEIKKISWTYKEDLEEGLVIDFNSYVSKLVDQLSM